jgi:hypothetical protein
MVDIILKINNDFKNNFFLDFVKLKFSSNYLIFLLNSIWVLSEQIKIVTIKIFFTDNFLYIIEYQ